jgi:hypothetical protein
MGRLLMPKPIQLLWVCVATMGIVAGVGVDEAVLAQAAPPAAVVLALPAPTGNYPVGVTDLDLTDPARADPWRPDQRRELMVHLWYPAAACEVARVWAAIVSSCRAPVWVGSRLAASPERARELRTVASDACFSALSQAAESPSRSRMVNALAHGTGWARHRQNVE